MPQAERRAVCRGRGLERRRRRGACGPPGCRDGGELRRLCRIMAFPDQVPLDIARRFQGLRRRPPRRRAARGNRLPRPDELARSERTLRVRPVRRRLSAAAGGDLPCPAPGGTTRRFRGDGSRRRRGYGVRSGVARRRHPPRREARPQAGAYPSLECFGEGRRVYRHVVVRTSRIGQGWGWNDALPFYRERGFRALGLAEPPRRGPRGGRVLALLLRASRLALAEEFESLDVGDRAEVGAHDLHGCTAAYARSESRSTCSALGAVTGRLRRSSRPRRTAPSWRPGTLSVVLHAQRRTAAALSCHTKAHASSASNHATAAAHSSTLIQGRTHARDGLQTRATLRARPSEHARSTASTPDGPAALPLGVAAAATRHQSARPASRPQRRATNRRRQPQPPATSCETRGASRGRTSRRSRNSRATRTRSTPRRRRRSTRPSSTACCSRRSSRQSSRAPGPARSTGPRT
mmetsp:Transcript_4959/g.15022  ORF Transcript_4959/g.15022 Transcript_4959/m.15022 type:complete len:464 (-) Transcript_4959:44-1435(-)